MTGGLSVWLDSVNLDWPFTEKIASLWIYFGRCIRQLLQTCACELSLGLCRVVMMHCVLVNGNNSVNLSQPLHADSPVSNRASWTKALHNWCKYPLIILNGYRMSSSEISQAKFTFQCHFQLQTAFVFNENHIFFA